MHSGPLIVTIIAIAVLLNQQNQIKKTTMGKNWVVSMSLATNNMQNSTSQIMRNTGNIWICWTKNESESSI